MLDLGFEPQLRRMAAQLLPQRQTHPLLSDTGTTNLGTVSALSPQADPPLLGDLAARGRLPRTLLRPRLATTSVYWCVMRHQVASLARTILRADALTVQADAAPAMHNAVHCVASGCDVAHPGGRRRGAARCRHHRAALRGVRRGGAARRISANLGESRRISANLG